MWWRTYTFWNPLADRSIFLKFRPSRHVLNTMSFEGSRLHATANYPHTFNITNNTVANCLECTSIILKYLYSKMTPTQSPYCPAICILTIFCILVFVLFTSTWPWKTRRSFPAPADFYLFQQLHLKESDKYVSNIRAILLQMIPYINTPRKAFHHTKLAWIGRRLVWSSLIMSRAYRILACMQRVVDLCPRILCRDRPLADL